MTRADLGPLFDVAAHQPLAPDGADWYDLALGIVRRIVRERGWVTSSLLRFDPQYEDPPAPSFVGALWAKLRVLGLVRTRDEVTSEVASRNQAREAVWTPGPAWR